MTMENCSECGGVFDVIDMIQTGTVEIKTEVKTVSKYLCGECQDAATDDDDDDDYEWYEDYDDDDDDDSAWHGIDMDDGIDEDNNTEGKSNG